LSKITSIEGRVLFNSRGSKTIEVDIKSDNKFLGRVCAPSGASVGKYEATSFPNGGPEESLKILTQNSQKFIGLDSSDLKTIHSTLKSLDNTNNYSVIGGALAFAVTIASMESASKSLEQPLFKTLSQDSDVKCPFPLGNILGGGAHAGPGTPDILTLQTEEGMKADGLQN
jgi:enolase